MREKVKVLDKKEEVEINIYFSAVKRWGSGRLVKLFKSSSRNRGFLLIICLRVAGYVVVWTDQDVRMLLLTCPEEKVRLRSLRADWGTEGSRARLEESRF